LYERHEELIKPRPYMVTQRMKKQVAVMADQRRST
jgi:hypothetical protein